MRVSIDFAAVVLLLLLCAAAAAVVAVAAPAPAAAAAVAPAAPTCSHALAHGCRVRMLFSAFLFLQYCCLRPRGKI